MTTLRQIFQNIDRKIDSGIKNVQQAVDNTVKQAGELVDQGVETGKKVVNDAIELDRQVRETVQQKTDEALNAVLDYPLENAPEDTAKAYDWFAELPGNPQLSRKEAQELKDNIVAAGEAVRDTAVATGEAVRDTAVATGEAVRDTAVATGEAVRDTAVATGEAIGGGVRAAGDYATEQIDATEKALQEGWGVLTNAWSTGIREIRGGIAGWLRSGADAIDS